MTEATVKAVAAKAAVIIYGNEGGYGSVNANDNGAVSVGKVQWHGSRALDLLKTIITKLGQRQAENILGAALYKEIKTAIYKIILLINTTNIIFISLHNIIIYYF